MGTYYSFHCTKCKVQGGFLSEQAWGTGNFNIVDTFKFVMLHALNCGPASIGMNAEHEYCDWPDTHIDQEVRLRFLEESQDIFPSSNDWGFIADRINQDWYQTKCEWLENERKLRRS